MIKLLYFAGLREKLGVAAEQAVLPAGVADVGALRAHLAARGGDWAALAAMSNLRAAVNHAMAAMDTPVQDGDEVAFFPPVTGG